MKQELSVMISDVKTRISNFNIEKMIITAKAEMLMERKDKLQKLLDKCLAEEKKYEKMGEGQS